MAEVQPRDIQRYITAEGNIPFDRWFNSLRNDRVKTIINKRINRARLVNLGDDLSVGEGVCEFKIDYRPGYRIYFGQINPRNHYFATMWRR